MSRSGSLHLAIDLRVTDAPGMEMTGVGRYALEVTRALPQARPQWRYSLFSNRPELLDGRPVLSTRLPTRHPLARVAWLHTVATVPTLQQRPHVWFSPSFVLPAWWRGPSVVTIHDLTFLLLRERYRGTLNARYATAATRRSARAASRILCGSQATSALLTSHLGINPEKVSVIPYGVAEVFFARGAARSRSEEPLPGEPAADRPDPYLLFVGTWEARKGLATLYEAMQTVNSGSRRVRLVLAGAPGWGTEELLSILRLDPNVELRERPDDAELGELYANALALVYASEMEGFGLPVAEAMASGCPVIATELPSIHEFAGDCPLYIDPDDGRGLAVHVETLLDGGVDLERWRQRASVAVAHLRWSTVAERSAELIEGAEYARAARSSRDRR